MSFSIKFDGKETFTTFDNGHWTGGGVVPEDFFHAEKLGITPEEHRLQHELAHHVIGLMFYGKPYSEVLWSAAHETRLPDYANEEEWLVTALQYRMFDKTGPEERNDLAAIQFINSRVDINEITDTLRIWFRMMKDNGSTTQQK